jgi:predicted AAA+ superfamily ATPase
MKWRDIMAKMVERPEYLNKLIDFREKDLIKIVTGIRRCGKSTLFDLYNDFLIKDGVMSEQIIRINLENPKYRDIKDGYELYDFINEKLLLDKMNYIFIDEVQVVEHFQKAVDGLYIKENCDVYITGSNAFLLSGELATLLSGRYVEIKMLPLSFKEYVSAMSDEKDLIIKYTNYLKNGSFPYILQLDKQVDIKMYLEGVYNSIIVKDILSRNKLSDMDILDRIVKFMFDNVGNICSSTKIANTLTSSGRKIAASTVENYLNALVESFVLYKVKRYDVKGKNYLTSGYKYYLCDIGLRYYLLGDKPVDMGYLLENIVYLELFRRGYDISVGKVRNKEIDFIVNGENGREYYQVAYSIADEDTLKRELASLNAVDDNYPKYLVTMDFLPPSSFDGIKQINALEWLLDK